METFIFSVLNNACRNKEEDKIDTIGPFALALYYSIDAEQYRIEDSESLPKYK